MGATAADPRLHRGGAVLPVRPARRPDRRLLAHLRHAAGGGQSVGEGGVGGGGASGCVAGV
jgi:hypothetical protein